LVGLRIAMAGGYALSLVRQALATNAFGVSLAELAIPALLGLALFLPALVAVVLVVQNAAVLAFPAWFPPGARRSSRVGATGPRAAGQRPDRLLRDAPHPPVRPPPGRPCRRRRGPRGLAVARGLGLRPGGARGRAAGVGGSRGRRPRPRPALRVFWRRGPGRRGVLLEDGLGGRRRAGVTPPPLPRVP